MRIRSVRVDRFAGIEGMEFDLPPGLTVISGHNESGKSTLMEFIRTGLFESRARKRYPAATSDDRGRLVVETEDGHVLNIDRKGRRLSNPEGGTLPTHLFSNMELSTYEGIFAIGLKELEDRAALTADRTRGHMGMPAGVRNLSRAYEELEGSCDDIMGKRGGSNKVAERLRDEVNTLRREIAELERELSGFEVSVSELSVLEGEREEVVQLQAATRERLEWLRTVNTHRENWLRSEECSSIIEERRHAEGFPSDGMASFNVSSSKLTSLQERLGTLKHDLQAVRENLDRISVDDGVIAAAEEIRDLNSHVPLRQKTIEDIQRSEVSLKERKESLRKERERLDWDTDSIVSADVSHRLIDDSRRYEESMDDLREGIRIAEQRARELEESLSAEVEVPAPEDATETEGQWPALRQAQSRLRDRETLESESPPFPRSILAFATATLVVIAAIAAYTAGLLTDPLFVPLIASPALPLTLMGVRMRRSEQESASMHQRRIEELHEELMGLLPTGKRPDWDGLRVWEEEIISQDREMVRREMARQRHEETLTRLTKDRGRLEAIEDELSSLKDELGEQQENWEALLRERGWPHPEEPEVVREMIRVVVNLRSMMSEVSGREEEIAAMRGRVDSLDRRMSELLSSLGMEAADFNHAAYRLMDRLQANIDDRSKAEGYRERITQMEASIRDLEEKADSAEKEIVSLVSPYGGEDGFRRAAEDHRKLEEAKLELGHLRRTLVGAAGNPEAYRILVQDMESMTTAEVEESIERLEEELSALTERRDELQRRIGDLESGIRRMSTDDRLSEKRQLLSVKEEELVESLREWSVMRLALMMLGEATSQFEKEKQPEVVRRAETYLRTMTGRDYRLISDLDRKEVVVVDDRTRRKEDMWSSGLGDQVNLSLRLALAQAMGRPEPLPMILDDVLVRFDPERRRGAAKAIAELAAEQQVLLFTCDTAVDEEFRNLGVDANHLRLEGRKLADVSD